MTRRSFERVVALALVSASLMPGPSGAASASVPDAGAELEETGAIPSLLLDNAVTAADMTGDGADELIVLSDNGVVQRYDVDTGFRWSVSTIEIADRLGIRPFEYTSRFEADYRGLFPCTTDHGVVFLERTGDDVLDVVATTWLQLREGSEVRQRSYVVELDGEDGSILALHRFEGHVTNLLPAGGAELFVVEEDGPVHQAEVGTYLVVRGTGGTTLIHRYDLEGARSVWTHDTGRSWGRVSAAAVGSLHGSEKDLAVVLASSAQEPVGGSVFCAAEPDVEPAGNDLVALDGPSGDLLWSSSVSTTVAELLTTAPAVDGRESLVAQVRGADGSSVRGFDAATGEARWTAPLPSGAVVWDIEPHGGRIAAAYAAPGPAAAAGDLARLALIDADTGALSVDGPVEIAPAPIERMRVVVAHLDGMAGREIVVQTDRRITAVDPTGEILWEREPLEAWNVLVSAHETAGDRLWIQGPVTPAAGLPGASAGGVALAPTEHLLGRFRLFGLDPLTGRSERTIPLMGVITGLTRLDVNGDSVPDRIMGGASETVFALDGDSQRLLWSRFLGDPTVDAVLRGEHPGRPVLDILTEDVTGDARPELIVEAHLAVFVLDSADGRIVWSYELAPTLGSGRWNGFELADLSGDGVRDVVLGTSSARSGGYNAIENAQLLAVDGTDGSILWHRPFPPPVKRVNGLDVGDANGDGTPDVGVALESMGTPWLYAVAMIDGRTGVPLWQRGERDPPGGIPAPISAARMIDAGDDGDADLAVLTWFDGTDGVVVRAHDGRTGDEVWVHPVGNAAAPGAEFGYGLYRGRPDPQGPEVLMVSATTQLELSTVGIVEGISPAGERVFMQVLPRRPWDIEVGDVTGDGAGDIVAPWIDGFGVIDGAAALAGDPHLLGHLVDRRPTKVKLFDVDGDGVLEIETFRTPQGWPLHIGHHLLRDDFGPGKAVSTVDLSPSGR